MTEQSQLKYLHMQRNKVWALLQNNPLRAVGRSRDETGLVIALKTVEAEYWVNHVHETVLLCVCLKFSSK